MMGDGEGPPDDSSDDDGDLWQELRGSVLLVGSLLAMLGLLGWLAAMTTGLL